MARLPSGLVSVADAASVLGITPSGVRAAIRAGRLAAYAAGSSYVLDLSEVERYRAARRRV